MVTFGEAIGLAYKNSFNFRGRATRPEFWWFALFNLLINVAGAFLGVFFAPITLAVSLFSIVSLPANISLLFRRIRDAGGSIYWIFAMWVSIFAVIVLAIASITEPSTAGEMGDFSSSGVPMYIALAGYVVSGLVCFVYTLMSSRK
jgi:uncharacterized membrane protein YhaH (DUF805 family)